MNELKYYYDEEHDILSVYNRETDFFAQFSPEKTSGLRAKFRFRSLSTIIIIAR